MCSAWVTHAQSHASVTNWRRTKWRKTRRAILLLVLSTKTTTERFLLKMCQWNGNSLRIIYNLQFERAIPGLIFSLLLFNKITLGVLLALLYKKTGKLISRVVKESSDSLFPSEHRLISLQYSGMLSISLRSHCLSPDMFCTALSHAKPPRNIHTARGVTLSRF